MCVSDNASVVLYFIIRYERYTLTKYVSSVAAALSAACAGRGFRELIVDRKIVADAIPPCLKRFLRENATEHKTSLVVGWLRLLNRS